MAVDNDIRNVEWVVESPMKRNPPSESVLDVDSDDVNLLLVDSTVDSTFEFNMWSMSYIGLYSQYAAVGLIYGSSGTTLSSDLIYSLNIKNSISRC